MSTSRLLEFDNLRNTRDLGGLKARGGRTILPGKLIRSGQLVGLTANDIKKLSSLVGTVVDMRTDGERKENPDVVLEGVRYIHNPIVGVLTPGVSREVKSVEELIRELLFKPDESLAYMCDLYRQFIRSDFCVSHYASFIRILLEDHDKAILWHCTAGKDRAGTSTIILQKLLGISDSDIVEDYLVTNEYLKSDLNSVIDHVRRQIGSDNPLVERSLKHLYGADRAYLDAFFSEMDERYGSFETFVHDALGLTDGDILRFRELYLR